MIHARFDFNPMRFSSLSFGGGLALAFAFIATAQEPPEAEQDAAPSSFEEIVNRHRNLTRFQSFLETYPDLYAALSIIPGLTVLAPSDEAFDRLVFSPLSSIFEVNDTVAIRNVLSYHTLNGTYPKNAFNGSLSFASTLLDDATVENVEGGQKIGGVQQAGGDLVFLSGLGSRSSVKRAVSDTDHPHHPFNEFYNYH